MNRLLKREVLPRLLPRRLLLIRGPARRPRVALTFDEGPDGSTPRYLAALAELRVQATFFLVGENIERHPETLAEYLRGGHELSCHSYRHESFPAMRTAELRADLRRAAALLPPGPGKKWLRPPFGQLSARTLLVCRQEGFSCVHWSLDSTDYRPQRPEELIAHLDAQPIAPGEILLFHEGMEWTLRALPGIIELLRRRGLEPVTLSRILGL